MMSSRSKLSLRPYRQWRRRAAKQFDCTEDAIERAIEEGKTILSEMRSSENQLVQALYGTYRNMPMYQACFMAYLYGQNPYTRMLLRHCPAGT